MSGAGSEKATDALDGQTLEARLKRLEEILGSLESDDMELDRSLELFEEGVLHIREAEKVLATAALRVKEVLSNGLEEDLDEPGSQG
jgi:exodeoxyribonuclease VII small subunit